MIPLHGFLLLMYRRAEKRGLARGGALDRGRESGFADSRPSRTTMTKVMEKRTRPKSPEQPMRAK